MTLKELVFEICETSQVLLVDIDGWKLIYKGWVTDIPKNIFDEYDVDKYGQNLTCKNHYLKIYVYKIHQTEKSKIKKVKTLLNEMFKIIED